ncbi:MAG TPA: hypothetical protein VKA46_20125, partial [Gemmataceae bacterium]|nr:hypothetical protein [Gemmataceae bacterium]
MLRSCTFWRLFGTFGLLPLLSVGLLVFVVVSQVDGYDQGRNVDNVRQRALLTRDALRGRTDDAAALQEEVKQLAADGGARIT